jgi:hypothetical protein
VLTAGCVATNPAWNPPGDADDDSAVGSTADEPDATSDAGDTFDDADASSSGSAESSWTGPDETSSGSPGADEGPLCEDGKTACDGECKDTSKDRKACGPACLDCDAMFGKDAECDAGECRADNSGPGGDDD